MYICCSTISIRSALYSTQCASVTAPWAPNIHCVVLIVHLLQHVESVYTLVCYVLTNTSAFTSLQLHFQTIAAVVPSFHGVKCTNIISWLGQYITRLLSFCAKTLTPLTVYLQRIMFTALHICCCTLLVLIRLALLFAICALTSVEVHFRADVALKFFSLCCVHLPLHSLSDFPICTFIILYGQFSAEMEVCVSPSCFCLCFSAL